MNKKENSKLWQELVAKAWTNEELKKQLFSNPEKVLKEHGIELPKGVTPKIVEDTDKEIYFKFPHPEKNLSKDELKHLSGGCGGNGIIFYPQY